MTNDDVFRIIEEASPNVSKVTIKIYNRIIRSLLKEAGSRVRYLRDQEKGEKAVDFIVSAMKESLDKANLTKDDIDLLIYCGVGKGFLEPANAYFYANYMGMRTNCYDICDACMSWIRALETAYTMTKMGRYKNVMIVNGEFNAYEHGLPENFKINKIRQAEYSFPTYTIGEAASATIVSASEDEWSFNFKSFPDYSNLCSIPLEGYKDYVHYDKRHNLNGIYKFVSFGATMFRLAEKHLPKLLHDSLGADVDKIDIYIPHAASDIAYLQASKNNGIPDGKMFGEVFPSYGNLVSASVPVGLSMAKEQGKLKRGDDVVLCPASAGMVFACVRFKY